MIWRAWMVTLTSFFLPALCVFPVSGHALPAPPSPKCPCPKAGFFSQSFPDCLCLFMTLKQHKALRPTWHAVVPGQPNSNLWMFCISCRWSPLQRLSSFTCYREPCLWKGSSGPWQLNNSWVIKVLLILSSKRIWSLPILSLLGPVAHSLHNLRLDCPDA